MVDDAYENAKKYIQNAAVLCGCHFILMRSYIHTRWSNKM